MNEMQDIVNKKEGFTYLGYYSKNGIRSLRARVNDAVIEVEENESLCDNKTEVASLKKQEKMIEVLKDLRDGDYPWITGALWSDISDCLK